MERNKRKIIVILTLIIMILQMCLPILQNVSYAAIDTNENDWDISVDESAGIIATLDYETGILTISGTGNMKNYLEINEVAPWSNAKTKITKLVIQEGVTNIGDYSFIGCTNLVEITIPEGITNIGKSAFKGCTSLKEITMPNTVATIGESAFSACNKLENINIPNGLERIEKEIFAGCSSLTNVTIPEKVTSIGESAFKNCSGLSNITIPEGVTEVGNSAFRDCRNLTNITIPNTVTNIGNMAFLQCTNLTNITLPEQLISIGEAAFKNSGLTNITIPANVTNIGDMAFANCTQLSEIKVAEENNTYMSIEGVLYTKDKTKIIKYPTAKQGNEYKIVEGTVSIAAYAFDSCTNLTQITIPEGVTSIENHAFDGCTNLSNVTMPSSLTSISEFAFSTCSGLTKITIPNGVTEIGKQAFFTCNNLTEIIIPDSVITIGDDIVNSNVNIICKTGSNAEKYAKENDKQHTTDSNGPKIMFIKNEAENEAVEINITVNVTDDSVGIDESSLKYTWSTKSADVQIDEITTSFKNGETLKKATETGTYYLWVSASDLLGNSIIQNSSEIVLDNTLPTITLSQSSMDKSNMTITVADIGSGLSENNDYKYYVSTSDTDLQRGEWKNYISGEIFTIEKGTTEIYYIFVKTISDNATNVSSVAGTMVTVGEETYHRFGPYTREKEEITFSLDGNEKWEENVSIQVSGLGKNLQEYYTYAWVEESTNLNIGDSSATLNCIAFEKYDYSRGFVQNVGTEQGNYNLLIIEKETGKIVAKSKVFYLGIEPVVEKYFTIDEYITDENYVKHIQPETSVEEFKNNITTNMNYSIKEEGEEITDGILKTGQTIEVENGDIYTIVVTADVDGDGKVKLSDVVAVNQYRLNNKGLEGAYWLAADINQDGDIDFKDISKINEYKLNKTTD